MVHIHRAAKHLYTWNKGNNPVLEKDKFVIVETDMEYLQNVWYKILTEDSSIMYALSSGQ